MKLTSVLMAFRDLDSGAPPLEISMMFTVQTKTSPNDLRAKILEHEPGGLVSEHPELNISHLSNSGTFFFVGRLVEGDGHHIFAVHVVLDLHLRAPQHLVCRGFDI